MEQIGREPLMLDHRVGRDFAAEDLGLKTFGQFAHIQDVVIVSMGYEDIITPFELI
jgi:hypothetical protein